MTATGGSSNQDSLLIIRDAPITFFFFPELIQSEPAQLTECRVCLLWGLRITPNITHNIGVGTVLSDR